MTEQTAASVSEPPFVYLSPKWALVAFLISSPALLAFWWFGHSGQGLVAYFSIAILVLLVRICWRLRGRWWVWLILAAFVISHLCLVALVPPFDLHSPAVVLVPVGLFDFLLWFTILWQAQKRLD
jgi:hypothetical protein